MILTVTLNSAIDRLLFIDEIKPGTTMRPQKMLEGVGGKGFDTSVVLQTLGAENLALGFVTGVTGRQLTALLDNYAIRQDLIWVAGETRIAHVLIETRHHRHSHVIAAGLSVSGDDYDLFIEQYQDHLKQASWVIAAGSIAIGVPISAYRQLVELAHQAGVPILIDSSGPAVLETVPVRPTILKMNQDEFSQTFNLQAGSMPELIDQARSVRQREKLPALVITCGATGTYIFGPEASYQAAAPPQQAVNAAGAGDGVSAALVWRLEQGDRWPEALRWAAATGAAVVLTERTAECQLKDIKRLRQETRLQTWPEA